MSNKKGMVIRSGKLKFDMKRDIPIYMLMLPAMLLIVVFCYLPMYGVIIGFQDFNPFRGVLGSPWVGLKNFIYFMSDSNFWRVMKNTVIINFYSLIFGFPAPIILALLINGVTGRFFKRTVQTISYLPYFISWVVVGGLILSILSPTGGVVNVILHNLFGMEPVYFVTQPKFFRAIVVASAIWKDIGMMSIYYLATLSTINPELYEAAIIDGANKWKQTLHVTLPGLKSIATVLLLLQIGNMVNIGFEQIFLLYNPLVYDVGDVISTYTYRLGVEQTQFSLTTAIGVTQSVVNFIMVFIANSVARKLAGWSLW